LVAASIQFPKAPLRLRGMPVQQLGEQARGQEQELAQPLLRKEISVTQFFAGKRRAKQ